MRTVIIENYMINLALLLTKMLKEIVHKAKKINFCLGSVCFSEHFVGRNFQG